MLRMNMGTMMRKMKVKTFGKGIIEYREQLVIATNKSSGVLRLGAM